MMKMITILTILVATTSFIFLKNHILPMLISMELMMISVLAVISMTSNSNSMQMILILISLMVAESACALSIMMTLTKNKGNEMMQMIS